LSAAICARIESVKPAGKAGWIHRLTDDGWRATRSRTIAFGVTVPQAGAPDLAKLAAQYVARVNAHYLSQFAAGLSLSVESLRRLRVGWASDKWSWSFPMTDAAGNVKGIRLRASNGRKWSVAGGHEGLFVPSDLFTRHPLLLICEGPTDCAALLDLGFAAVGRPSCTGGVALLVDFVKRRQPVEAIIVADGDPPGKRGAQSLATVLGAYCAAIRIITPPCGIKDARAWKQSGATAADVHFAIDAAPLRRFKITTKLREAQQ
jgi:hypothetical protein